MPVDHHPSQGRDRGVIGGRQPFSGCPCQRHPTPHVGDRDRTVVAERVGVVGYLVVALVALTAPLLMRRPELARRIFEPCALVGALAGLVGGALR